MRSAKEIKSEIDAQVKSKPTEVSIIKLVELLVEHGYVSRASDIHIEPADDNVVVRFRIDGILSDAVVLPKEMHSEIISRIKVLSDLKTDIHQVPQDGRFRAKVEAAVDKVADKKRGVESPPEEVDVRVSVAPTYYGENAVLRILAENVQSFNVEDLGFSPKQLKAVMGAIEKPYGMILCNGPTGSGKTTTLYTVIRKLNTREVSIITIEDPIEYSIGGITQIPVNITAGLNFANGLRSILRQDPNIVMVGEIRDSDTANIAVNAALTGHLMLSTLHTNDAATTFPRLVDMGVPPFLVASTLNVVIGQRLVRKVCPKCRIEKKLAEEEVKGLGEIAEKLKGSKIYSVGKGCSECDMSGYKGRIGIHEVLEVDEKIRQLVLARADASQIKQAAVQKGMVTMVEDGIQKAQDGTTTLEEVARIVYE